MLVYLDQSQTPKTVSVRILVYLYGVMQIGPANPKIQRVLDALDVIKTKVKITSHNTSNSIR